MGWHHQNKLRLWARISLVVLLLSIVRQLILILQSQYQLTSPFVPQSSISFLRPLLIIGLITTLASIVGLLFYFLERYNWVIIWAILALIGPHFYPYFLY